MRSDLTFLSYIVQGYSFFVDTVYIALLDAKALNHVQEKHILLN